MMVVAVGLAAVLLDQPLPESAEWWWLHQGSGGDAVSLLSTLLAALIPMAALLVSITMVVLTLAAGQLGPRIIRNFMGDLQTQVTLGLFMSTMLYMLIVLRTLNEDMAAEAVPRLAVAVGTWMVMACLAALLFFVHTLARSIISDTMIGRVGADLDAALLKDLPASEELVDPETARPPGPGVDLRVRRSGYVRTMDARRLVKRARDLGVFIEVLYRPGHYLVAGSIHARVWGDRAAVDKAASAVRAALAMGGQRDAAQDLEFSVRQLVEIALRALSPGINDEFTAITVIDRLTGSLSIALGRPSLHRVLCDDTGTPRLLRPVSGFAGLCDVAFDQIRQAAGGHPAVQMRVIENLGTLLALAEQPAERAALVHHLDLMIESVRLSGAEPYDLQAMEQRYRNALLQRPEE